MTITEQNTIDTTEPTKTQPNKPPRLIWLTIIIVIAFILFAWMTFSIVAPLQTQESIVRIKPGESTRVISAKLKSAKIIRSAFWFNVLARLTKCDRQLKAGRYVFGGDVSLWQTITKIKEGRSTLLHLTIPEGFSLYNTVKLMAKSGIGPYDSLLAIATNPAVARRLTGYDVTTLEGFLYPETYAFDIDLAPRQIFGQMTEQFFARIKAADITITDFKAFYNDLILASIVEQEAVREEEKPLIAGVFLNRLKKNMKLESCPTVDYTLEREGIQRKQLTYDDLQIDTPYNTYKISGLPPSPICNPSITSLQAVINPEITEYLYFFADFQGHNVFSKTYTEHINKQKNYQQ